MAWFLHRVHQGSINSLWPVPPHASTTNWLCFVLTTLGNFTLAELGICEPSPHQNAYCPEIGLLQRGYSLSAGSDADSDPEGPISPERAIQLWGGQGIKSRRSSGLSSRENSALTLTDSDNENKSDDESGERLFQRARKQRASFVFMRHWGCERNL